MPTLIATGQTYRVPVITGADSYALCLGTQEPGSRLDGCTIDGAGAEWGLKMPNNTGSRIVGGSIVGGKERALDMVRGSGIEFAGTVFACGEDRQATRSPFSLAKQCDVGAKGGVQAKFSDCVLTDLLAGDFCIYDSPRTGPKARIELIRCRHPNPGSPIIVRALNADVILVDSRANEFRVPAFAVAIYFSYARTYVDTRVGPSV